MVKFVRLKSGREKSVLRRHPWIFSGAVDSVSGNPGVGDTVEVRSASGQRLGLGAFSPASQIRVRLWTFGDEPSLGSDFFAQRIQAALTARTKGMLPPSVTAYRLINAESDGLPGLVVDRYQDVLVGQFLSAGAEFWKSVIVKHLEAAFPNVTCIYERSDVDVRQKEGLPLATGALMGSLPPEPLRIQEYGASFWVDPVQGHKTGFYLDQRLNRVLTGQYANGAEVLNCFAYTGGFSVTALKGGATHITQVEASAPALHMAAQNVALNGCDPAQVSSVEGDVFHVLRHYRDQGRQFDVIILDPPKFADSQAQVERASRGYKDINWLAFRLLKPGGILMTFSCSGRVSADLFQKIVAGAALDSGREVRLLQRLTQGPDHPVALSFPEGDYLKGLVCQVE